MMPYNMQPREKYLDSAANMNADSRERQQQNLKTLKERIQSRQGNKNLKCQGKLKVKASFGPQCSDLSNESRQEGNDKTLFQPKSSGNHQSQYHEGKSMKDDELVKYMSTLPGYLKRMEGEKNVQDKALNVGVLDWARLEEWKYNQKRSIASGSNNVPSTFSGVTQEGTHAHRSEAHPSLCPGLNSSKKDGLFRGVKPSSQKALQFHNFKTSSQSNLRGQKNIPRINKPLDRNNADGTTRKAKTKNRDQKITSELGNLSTISGKYGTAPSTKDKVSSWDDEMEKRVEEDQVSNRNRKALDKQTFSDMGASYPKSRSKGVSLSSKEKISASNMETKKRTEKLKESNIDLGHEHLPGELANIVLLLPKELSQNSSSKESRVPPDENLVEANQICFSGGSFSSVKSCCVELSSDIPHSSPWPSELESKIKPNLMPHSLIDSQSVELPSDSSHLYPYSSGSSAIFSKDKDAEQNIIKHVNENADEKLKLLDQEMVEMAVTRSRNPSPNRWFSFSSSRMGRSYSWKENSGVRQLSSSNVSDKSGPVKYEEVSCVNDTSRDRTNSHNRARSSPLRRILDPLLRSRSSNRGHATEAVPPSKGNSSYFKFRQTFDGASLPNKKHEPTTQAFVQLTIKNGLPLFKFVIDNNNSVLAATMKNLLSGKDDSCENYTFYSVNEIKKKGGGWISQGSKQKSCGFVYNVIGQMVSRSHFSNLKVQNLKSQYVVKESVLFDVELKQVDQASPKFMPNEELAAVVVKMPIDCSSHDAEQRDNETAEKDFKECFSPGRCSYSEGIEKSCSTTVILPIGVHGLPDKGAPSPLIKRWKSGGFCDCGGWDVGCELRVLPNRCQMTSIACSNSYGFQLFEGGAQQNSPIFSLLPLNKETYSVEFNSSISSLQAFFISVTVISSQKSSDLSGVSSQYEAEVFQEEPVMDEKGTKTSSFTNVVLGKMPAKYAPNSPVGRV